jgi:hypothetical protein
MTLDSDASKVPRVVPGERPGSIAVTPSLEKTLPIGIASGAGWIGGYDWENDRDLGPVRAPGRAVLRAGRGCGVGRLQVRSPKGSRSRH